MNGESKEKSKATLLAALKAHRKEQGPSIHSELVSTPSPLSLFLHLYSKSTRECNINYMEGAKALLKWLSSPASPLTIPVDTYPEILNPNFYVPRLLSGGHEGQEIAAHIVSTCYVRDTFERTLRNRKIVANAIYFIMSREIICELY